MSKYIWPVTMLEGTNASEDLLLFFSGLFEESDRKSHELDALYAEHQLLKATSSKQDRYIAELEKQLSLLQKTLDLVDKNTPRTTHEFRYEKGYQPHGAEEFAKACNVCVNYGSDLCRECKKEKASGFEPAF